MKDKKSKRPSMDRICRSRFLDTMDKLCSMVPVIVYAVCLFLFYKSGKRVCRYTKWQNEDDSDLIA